MTYWMQKLPKYVRIGPYGLAATKIIILSVLFRVILVVLHFPANSNLEIAAFERHNKEHGKHFQKYTLDGMVLYIPTLV